MNSSIKRVEFEITIDGEPYYADIEFTRNQDLDYVLLTIKQEIEEQIAEQSAEVDK